MNRFRLPTGYRSWSEVAIEVAAMSLVIGIAIAGYCTLTP